MKKLILCLAILTFSLHVVAAAQDVNKTDAAGKKTGLWKVYGNDKTMAGKGFAATDVAEEGQYLDGKKTGEWKLYYPGGKIKSTVEYKNGRPNGKFITYYQNGQVEEEGTWKNNVYQGSFKRYYENGQLAQEKTFNAAGKTDGPVKYIYPNGKTELEYTSKNGVEEGEMKRYYPNGDLEESKVFTSGAPNAGTEKKFAMKNPPVKIDDMPGIVQKEVKTDPNLKTNPAQKEVPDGYQKLLDDQQRIVQDGLFKGGKLKDGKWYKYDKNGLLDKIEVYKNFKYFADAQLDK